MTIHRRRDALISYVPLQPVKELPTRQDDEPAPIDPASLGLPNWGWTGERERLSSRQWGRMNAPRVRSRPMAYKSSKMLRAQLNDLSESLTTSYLLGGEPDAQDLATLEWSALCAAVLASRQADLPAALDEAQPAEAPAPESRNTPEWPPPDAALLSTAGHTLTLAARAPGALRLIVA